ncbi:hypothetical protein Sango_3106200 [Sesamum angolense]|uniref:DUF4283 domain-containing protein n=1 Tax=Sesamum angolense TaxID=2727404 RepID=A0AAE1T9D2_9LAMI|nr:hypothetical protein Sango_3106200 [Sesamum angolense]
MAENGEEGELDDGGHDAVTATPATPRPADGDPTMEKLKAEFNIKEFFELASRVIEDGDLESMEALKALKRKWTEKLGGEVEPAVNGGIRPVPLRQLTPFPAALISRPARRGNRWPTAELLKGAAPEPRISCDEAPHLIMTPRVSTSTGQAPVASGFEAPRIIMTPRVSNGLLAAAATNCPLAAVACDASNEAPSVYEKSTPTQMTAITIDTFGFIPVDFGHTDFDWFSTVRCHLANRTERLAHRLNPITSSSPAVVHPAVVHVPLPPWNQATLTQQHAAPLPTVSVGQQPLPAVLPAPSAVPATTAAPATYAAPATSLSEIFIGNVPLHPHSAFKVDDDKIATAFHNSSRKTLNFIPPSVQNGEVIVRPSIDTIRAGSHRWKTTAVGYFLGKKPYFHHLNEFVRSIWPGVRDVKATSNGFFFFQFETVAAMEDVIEGGPWLYLGQPIVLQKWEPGMVLRKLKHTEVPVWIKLRHLPVELWTTEGLSTVASGIGRPLYPDTITRACTRLDFARVCIMLNVSSKLPKHVVIMMPNELGGESACKYEGMPSFQTNEACGCDLCEETSAPTPAAPELKFSEQGQADLVPEEIHPETETDRVGEEMSEYGKDKSDDIVLFNAFDVLRETNDDADEPRGGTTKLQSDLVSEFRLHFIALLETRVMQSNVTRIQSGVLSRWQWFVDYAGPGNRIWIAWNDELIDVEFLNVGSQFVHCRILIHELHETILITVVYGANEVSARRELWQGLIELAVTVGNMPWLVGGDFNAVLDMSETGLLSMPMQGERFTWHNRSLDGRSLWKRLDRLLVNDVWMDRWPNLFYTCLTPRTSDHSPLVLKGDCRNMQHPVIGTPMYSVTRKLKALKLVYLKASKLEQVMLRQRAKLQWLKGGDQCSKVFFRRVATRRANKRIFQISDDDGNEQTEPTIISSIFVDFFQGLLGGDRTDRAIDLRYLRHGLGIFSRMTRLGLLFVLSPLMRSKQLSLILRRTKPLDQMDIPRVSLKLPGRLWVRRCRKPLLTSSRRAVS